MVVHSRPTRPTERFVATDLWIAWVDKEAAGRMAESREAAVRAVLLERLSPGTVEAILDQMKANGTL